MGAGRPCLCTPGLVKRAKQYLAGWEGMGRAIPSNDSLCLYLGISKMSLSNWVNTAKSEENEDENKVAFANVVEKIGLTQFQTLTDKGLTDKFNGPLASLFLGQHGLHRKQDISTPDGFTINIGTKDAGNL